MFVLICLCIFDCDWRICVGNFYNSLEMQKKLTQITDAVDFEAGHELGLWQIVAGNVGSLDAGIAGGFEHVDDAANWLNLAE